MDNIRKSPFDIEAIRANFPVLHQEVRPGVPLVYLDNAATSQKPQAVIDSMTDYYAGYNANVHRGIHKLSEAATDAYEDARARIARFINAKSHREIIYTRNTTESLNLLAQTWGQANIGPGDIILSTEMEHHSNIVPWQMLAEQKSAELRYIPITEDGQIDIEAYQDMLDERVKLVATTHMSNVLGTITPIADIIATAHAAGAIVVVDGAQSVPHMPVDVQALDADFYVFSGHKMLGPTGIGILYGKRDLLEAMPPYMYGGDMIKRVTFEGAQWNDLPWKFEAGTPSIAQAIGLGAAVDYLTGLGMENVLEHERYITEYAMERLSEVPGLTVHGPQDAHKRGAVAAFTMDGVHPHDAAQILDHEGLAVRAGHHCAMPLHDKLRIVATTRASFYMYNTTSEVDKLIEALYKAKKVFTF